MANGKITISQHKKDTVLTPKSHRPETCGSIQGCNNDSEIIFMFKMKYNF